MSTALSRLPVLRGEKLSSEVRPVVIVDSREQTPLRFERLTSRLGTLTSGDYAPAGLEHLVAIERKSMDDLVGSLTTDRERFERELHRLRGFRFARVLVTAPRADLLAGRYRSKATPAALLASVTAFEVRYAVPFVFAEDETEAARLVELWLFYATREVTREYASLLRGIGSGESEGVPDAAPAPTAGKQPTASAITAANGARA